MIYQNTWSSNFCYISLRTFRIVRQNRQTYGDFPWNGNTRIQQVDYNREALCLLWAAYQLEAAFKADKVVHGHVVPLGDPAINSERLLVADCLDLCEYRDARDRIKWKFINVYTTREHISVEFFAVNDVRCELLLYELWRQAIVNLLFKNQFHDWPNSPFYQFHLPFNIDINTQCPTRGFEHISLKILKTNII